MFRNLRIYCALALCCACSSSGSSNAPAGNGGAAGSGGGTTTDADADAGSGEAAAGNGAAAGTSAEAGQAGASEPEPEPGGAGGTQSLGGAPSAGGGKSGGAGGKGSAGSGGSFVGSCSIANSECGGNLTGTWAVSLTCVDVKAVTSGPLAGCEGISYRLATEAVITFAADYSLQQTTTATQFNGVFDIPKACASSGSCASAAADLGTVKNTSTETKGDVCEVSGTLDNVPDTDSSTYTVNGNKLVVNGDTDPRTFCVTGNTLVFKVITERQVVVQTLTRQ